MGYDWPAEYRGALKTYSKTLSKTKGTYTITIPKPSAHVGRLKLKLNYTAGRYTEKKIVAQVFHAPNVGVPKTNYHTVKKGEVAGDFFAYYAVPGVFFNFSPAGKLVKIAGNFYLGWSLWDNYSTRTTLSKSFPHPVQGQYYKITTWYSSNFKLNTKIQVWSNKESYSKGITPGTYTTYVQF